MKHDYTGTKNPNYRHGGHTTNRPEYNSWRAMKYRCNSPGYWAYSRYGGRGITVCDRWLGKDGFANFLSDMGKKPTPKYSIDRIDNSIMYSPDNCKGSNQRQQTSNMEKNRIVTIDGESNIVSDWAKIKGISLQTIYSRVSLGWSWQRAVTTPTKGVGSNQSTY